MWYEITDTSVVLHAIAYSAGWADLRVGGFLYARCDTFITDTLHEELVDLETPYTTAQWWVRSLVPQQSYCWWAYVRYDTTYFFAPNGIYFSAHASPTTIGGHDLDACAGYVDAGSRMLVAMRDMVVYPMNLVGQLAASPFIVRKGEAKDVSQVPVPCFLVGRNPLTGTVMGRYFLPPH